MALLLAGLPEDVLGVSINRLCASRPDALVAVARVIQVGEADLVVAGGAENMTRAPLVMAKTESAFPRRAEVPDTTIGCRFVNLSMAAAYGTCSWYLLHVGDCGNGCRNLRHRSR